MQKLYLSVLYLHGITVPHGLQKVAVVTSPSVVYLNIYPFHSVFPVLSIVNFYTFFFFFTILTISSVSGLLYFSFP